MNLRMMDPKVKEALFGVESTHHIHGQECLCGFKSAVSRDRTKHILAVTLDAMSGQVETLVGQLDAADRQIEARSGTTAAERIWKARAEAAEAKVAAVRELGVINALDSDDPDSEIFEAVHYGDLRAALDGQECPDCNHPHSTTLCAGSMCDCCDAITALDGTA